MPKKSRRYRPKPRDEVARNMAAIRSKENKTERALRSELHRRGLRYRKYVAGILGKPDIVFPTEQLAVFVDGDYWHGRVFREVGETQYAASLRSPTEESRDYWVKKMRRNTDRDDQVTKGLEANGWLVLRLWESEVKKDLSSAADLIDQHVRIRRREVS